MVKKNVFLISLQKAVGQYKLGIGPNTLSFFITPLVSRKVTFLCKMQFFEFMQEIMKKYPKFLNWHLKRIVSHRGMQKLISTRATDIFKMYNFTLYCICV
jgi:hypothetical protein